MFIGIFGDQRIVYCSVSFRATFRSYSAENSIENYLFRIPRLKGLLSRPTFPENAADDIIQSLHLKCIIVSRVSLSITLVQVITIVLYLVSLNIVPSNTVFKSTQKLAIGSDHYWTVKYS